MARTHLGLAGLLPIAVLLVVLLGGCAAPEVGVPDALLPGVRTETTIGDSFRCGELLFAQGCAIVRIDRVESGCAGEVGGYVLCNATLDWSATAGAVEPGSRLETAAGGVAGPSCEPVPGHPCRVTGTVTQTQRLSGPGDDARMPFAFTAALASPSGLPATTGEFSLAFEIAFRSEDLGELTT